MVVDNKYVMAERQEGIQRTGRPVVRTSRYSLVIHSSSSQLLVSVEVPQGPEQEVCAQRGRMPPSPGVP